ncbi:Uncharacterised protein [Bordetella ansorpii]|uniref:Uncharacterized protein n=1 Tax=Bordetella ansorpii TaxID=288768 RepID=A0A157SHT3_9BORD|nr:Uncharacterised protein [Bordetella ansorpii]
MKAPPYALSRAPQGAALADRQSRIRRALAQAGFFHAPSVACSTVNSLI